MSTNGVPENEEGSNNAYDTEMIYEYPGNIGKNEEIYKDAGHGTDAGVGALKGLLSAIPSNISAPAMS